ncbi:CHAD domain-containing protein [Geomonas subterranea]|uniref:CHAD domain-containing protein n=1 Tax=Geomonas subterranea TaxID=2847989 RepID=A0ABX8LEF6_9BACT|nr:MULTISPECIES: CHAD domain-containing protein [Geomonas]QXE89005.1 CHAD domain-containing protein [Geomonas subterranea]QXM08877.1 CHAD domain-containing protein [Geomonas subterranea]
MSIPADRTPTLQLHPARLWFAASHLLAVLHREFFAHWRGALRRLDLDEVHDLRVASRRLREGLALFAPLLPGKKVAKMSRRVKRLTTLLGELRNVDEALRFFSGLDGEEPGAPPAGTRELLQTLSKERETVRKELVRALAGFHVGKLKKELAGLSAQPNPFRRRGVDPFTGIGLFAAGALAERATLVEELFPAALHEEDTVAQHRLRIAFKKLRYRLEILAPLLEDEGEQLRRVLKSYQDLLGQLHDLDVFADMVEERVAQGGGRERLLHVLAARRAGLFAVFAQTRRDQPLEPLTRRISEELRLPRRPGPAGIPP